jgi:hypothetical protein
LLTYYYQTRGKSLEEIDILFAKDEVKKSLLTQVIVSQGIDVNSKELQVHIETA